MEKYQKKLLEMMAISTMLEPSPRTREPQKQCIRSKDSPSNKNGKRCKYSGSCEGHRPHCKFKLYK